VHPDIVVYAAAVTPSSLLLALTAPATAGSAYTLADPVVYSVQARACAARIADVTGDGRDDVVVATSGRDLSQILVYPQLADGTLGEPTSSTFAGGSTSVMALEVADLDGDGAPEVIVSGYMTGTDVFFGSQYGRLDGPYGLDARDALDVLATDVDADGDLDVVLAANGAGLHVLENDGAGEFAAREVAEENQSWELAHVDVTGDGVGDLVGAAITWDPMVEVREGRGDGTFAAEATSWAEGRPSLSGILAAGDFDGDGAAEVAVAGDGNRPVSLYVFQPGGEAVRTLTSYDIPATLDAGDLDGDGDLDLVVGHNGWGAVTLHLQEDDGLAALARYDTPVPSELGADGVALGDVTGDGCADVVVADSEQGLLVLVGDHCGETTEPVDTGGDTGGPPAEDTATGDSGAPADTAQDTGDALVDLPIEADAPAACGCAAGPPPLGLALVALLGARRARRRA
jgi:hypothetical protein